MIATTAVAVAPVVVAWRLQASGTISSPWVAAAIALALSLGASIGGSAYWKRRRGGSDLLFSELLLWGWIRRWWVERQVVRAVETLGLDRNGQGVGRQDGDAERNTRLLSQLASAIEAQDSYTNGHSRRVAGHSVMVARKMGLSRSEVAKVGTAAAVHDVGKLRVPPEILNKPGPLTSSEFAIVKRHAEEGAQIVASVGDPELSAIVLHHHEHFDGTGYPSGLHGEEVPLGSRIIAVADTFDAVTSIRPYRAAAPHKRALDVLAKTSGTQLDPVAVRAFLRCYSGNKAAVFWMLLAISPQRAIALLRGKTPAQGTGSFGAIAAATAAVAAVVAAAIGSPVSAGPARYQLHQSQQAAILPVTPAGAARAKSAARHATAHDARRATGAHHATSKPHVAPVVPRRVAHHASVSAPAVVRKASNLTAPPRHRVSGGSVPPKGSVPRKPPPPAHTPAAGIKPPVGGGSTGGGGPGATSPLTKKQCKKGGYANHGFSNQGRCVASVEPGPK